MKHLKDNLYCEEENFYGAILYLRHRHESWAQKSLDESERDFVKAVERTAKEAVVNSGKIESVYKGVFMTIEGIIPPGHTKEISLVRLYQFCR